MNPESSPKRAHKHKGKGKENADSEFRSVRASVVLAVPPVFANRLRDGVEEMLDTMTMRSALWLMHSYGHLVLIRPARYEPTLNGVVLAHSDVRFLDNVARLQGDSPFAICHVGFEALVWSPQRGMSLCVCRIQFLSNSSLMRLSNDDGIRRACHPLIPGSCIATGTPHIQRVHPATSHPR
jgi:hypothetical protein